MRTRDMMMMMMSGDNLRGNSPFRSDLFEFERYFDMSPCISIFFASIFSSSSWLFLSAKERETTDESRIRASLSLVVDRGRVWCACPREGRSFIVVVVQILIIWCLLRVLERINFVCFIFFLLGGWDSTKIIHIRIN